MATTDIGRAVPLLRGEYDPAQTYELNDIVSLNGSLYWHYSHEVTTNVAPQATSTWKVVLSLTDAEAYIARAETAAEEAESAKDDAVTAKTAAETASATATGASEAATAAKDDAVTARNAAQTAETGAVEAKNAAVSAKEAAQSAASSAGTSATSAGNSAGTAEYYAENAETAAETATTKASEASASAATASSAATTATGAKSAAETAASTATTKAGEASTFATSAAAAKDDAELARDKAEEYAEALEVQIDPTFRTPGTGAESVAVSKKTASAVIGAASGNAAVIPDAAAERVLRSVKVNVEPAQSGYGDPSTSNVRPISGWTGAKVTRCGKNLLSSDAAWYTVGSSYRYKNGVVPNGIRAVMSFRDKDTTVDVSDISFGFTDNDLSAGEANRFRWCLSRGVIQTYCSNIAMQDNTIFCRNVFMYPKTDEAFGRLFARYDIQVEIGTAGTDFEPYAGDVFDVSFPSEAGTVYGGVLDVTAGTLTVDRAYMSLTGAEGTWLASGAYEKKYFGVFVGDEGDGVTGSGVCSHFSPINTDISTTSAVGQRMYSSSAYHKSIFAFRPENVTDMSLADFRTWVADQAEAGTPLQISWKLTQTQVYAVNAEIIAAMAGVNTVWADCGPVEIKYVRDTGAAIEAANADTRAMIGEASSATASRSLAVGEYVTVGDKLYRITSAIGAGETLTPGSNVTETTVGAELTALFNLINS